MVIALIMVALLLVVLTLIALMMVREERKPPPPPPMQYRIILYGPLTITRLDEQIESDMVAFRVSMRVGYGVREPSLMVEWSSS